MKSAARGQPTSVVEVTNVSKHGFWLLLDDREQFLSFEHFPWFRDVSIGELCNVQLPHPHHLYWPDLDVDVAVESIPGPAEPAHPAAGKAEGWMGEIAYTYFRVKGDQLPLDDITSCMGIVPTESWQRGDPGKFNPSRPDAGWCLYGPLPRSELSLDRHIDALLALLDDRSSVILDLGQQFEVWVQCVGYYSSSSPGFHLSRHTVQRIAKLGLPIDVDLYFHEYRGDE